MIKRFIIVGFLLALVFGGIAGFNMFRDQAIKQAFAPKEPPPAIVSTAPATRDTWVHNVDAIGGLYAIHSVDLAPQISGIVTEIAFEPGQRVTKGDVLVRLDASVENADLKRLEAVRWMSQLTFDRQKQLNEKQYAAQAQVDQAKATLATSEADIARIKALIDQKTIRAPFSGVLGVRIVNLGQYVGPGTKLVGLQALERIWANITIPEQHLANVRVGQTVVVKVDAFKDQEFKGKITTIDPQLDQNNRTVLVQATIDNAEFLLKPGMFVNAQIQTGRSDELVSIPKSAVDYSLYGDSVYVVSKKTDAEGKTVHRVERRPITMGEQLGNRVAVLKGVEAGEEVVTAGQVKLINEQRVMVDNTIALKPDSSQTPEKSRR